MPMASGRAFLRTCSLTALALFALGLGGCGKSSGVDDKARLDACVLMGATTNDGCDTSGAAPALKLGDLTMGAVKTRDVALYNGGAGAVAATVSAVALEGATANYAILKVFRLDAALAEVPVTLPYDLAVSHGSELRVRVAFTANAAVGAVSGAVLRVTASHPAVSAAIPITGQITGCPAGRGDCDHDPSNGCEVDLQTDMANCGACAAACGSANATAACTAGACQISCAAGFGNCDGDAANGCETDLLTDPAHCSACGTACDATNGTPACSAGACGIACAPGFADCDGNAANGCEVNLGTDPSHCGACGTLCGSVNGTGTCSAGLCVTSCDPGFANCDGNPANGCEVNVGTDPSHCGTCGTACSTAGGTAACAAGACQITCSPGFADCDGSAANGCEVNLGTDPAHCGACATACNATNGTATCTASVCGLTCKPGYANCDNNIATNGCETNIGSDVTNCGACGATCSSAGGTPSCTAGACQIACSAGFANCDGSAANGCEVNLGTDLANCGACGNACGTANATAACTAGACGLACNAGYADCNGLNADGCETSLLLDAANCGGCGIACSAPNATPACAGGACAVGTCNAGFADCNGNPADGCEVDFATDPNNCGGCGNVCSAANGTSACVSGLCAVAACNPGYADCDGNPANGCEVHTAADLSNCGACGNVCPPVANGTPACSASTCGIGTCSAGWGNCDANPANGCETNTTNNISNCGACGNACTNTANVTATTCSASACAVTLCNGGYYDIDGSYADGCECATAGTSAACAAPTALGALTVGQSAAYTGNLVPAGQEAWLVVTFTSNLNYSYHPSVSLTAGASEFKFDLLTNCTGTPAGSCGNEGGSSTGVTSWETVYTGGDPGNPLGYFQPIPPPGASGTVLIHVYRATGLPVTCNSYTLTISN